MSVKVMAAVFASDLPPNLRIILLAAADNADDDGYAWSSVATIARKSGYTPRHTTRLLADLCEAGAMIPVPEQEWPEAVKAIPHRYRPTVYLIQGCQDVTPQGGSGVTYPAPRGDISHNSGVTLMSPDPIRNPKKPCQHLFEQTENTDERGLWCVRCRTWVNEERTA